MTVVFNLLKLKAMEIKTKYQIYKDLVWFLDRNGKAQQSYLDKVIIDVSGYNNFTQIKYKLRNNYRDEDYTEERHLFLTKEDLLKSI